MRPPQGFIEVGNAWVAIAAIESIRATTWIDKWTVTVRTLSGHQHSITETFDTKADADTAIADITRSLQPLP